VSDRENQFTAQWLLFLIVYDETTKVVVVVAVTNYERVEEMI
jgi:hypothetical protein